MTKSNHPAPAVSAGALPADLTERLRALRDGLLTGLVERDVAIRLALIAALAGEHLLLIGPPGTAKSLIARRLHLAFDDSTYFERLLTRFTVPEELFGPLSIQGLENDEYKRLTAAYLPTASIAFLDEIFKANSAILNALLTLLNEREFDNGVRREQTPLIAVIGASNELPEGEELDALFDRFLMRLHVGPVSKDAFPSLLALRGESTATVSEGVRLTAADLAAVQSSAQSVAVPDDVVALLCDLREWCMAEEIEVSDRRWRKVVKLLQVAALTNGRDEVSIWDCWLLQHCLWNDPGQRPKVYDWYAARVGASAAMDPSSLTKIVVYQEAQLQEDKDSRSQRKDDEGRLLWETREGEVSTSPTGKSQRRRGNEPLFLAPPRASTNNDYDYEQYHIKDRQNGRKGYTIAELDRLWVNMQPGNYRNTAFKNWPDRDAYLADSANWYLEDVELTPAMEPTRHKRLYVEACLRSVDELRTDVAEYAAGLERHMGALDSDIRSHLWVTADFVEPATVSLEETRHEVSTLLARVEKIRKGFELLPQEDGPQGVRPPVKTTRTRKKR